MQRGHASLSFALRPVAAGSTVVSLLLLVLAAGPAVAAGNGSGVESPAAAAAGADVALPPAAGSPAGPATTTDAGPHLEFAPFHDKAFLEARKNGVPTVLVFEAEWCAPCKEMHERTYRAPEVLEAAAGARFFRIDMTVPDPQVGILTKSFRVHGAPTVIFFGPDGKERSRRFGFIPPGEFADMLAEARKPPRGA